ncbi:hypothetical protein [Luteibacter yeojuensis]|uniref:Uncharacterized protein n=1 Tax=Luteibacter yeojuensis TaxID=345309 RepID=A0A7X5QT86_9GAMM|nr:hypothetical protein [Luteibacter yeojuensis]NID14995.1 hypothetical protein [Luteibacter yeojuensis]
MEASEIRRRNIEMLVRAAGGPGVFARRVGREQTQVSQWISVKTPKAIGGRLARDIEEHLGHERGWLDRPQWMPEREVDTADAAGFGVPSAKTSEELRPAADTLTRALIVTERVLDRTKVAVKPEARASIVMAVYDMLNEGQGMQAAENVVSRMLDVVRGAIVTD